MEATIFVYIVNEEDLAETGERDEIDYDRQSLPRSSLLILGHLVGLVVH